VAAVLLAYLALNALYGVWLKNVVIVDVFAIAAFFVMRLVAGAVAVSVTPSIWLLLCGGLLALYLGFAKRRHELVLLGGGSQAHRGCQPQHTLSRPALVLLSVTVVSYIVHARTDTARIVGSECFLQHGVRAVRSPSVSIPRAPK
jgi:hypothetical protein